MKSPNCTIGVDFRESIHDTIMMVSWQPVSQQCDKAKKFGNQAFYGMFMTSQVASDNSTLPLQRHLKQYQRYIKNYIVKT